MADPDIDKYTAQIVPHTMTTVSGQYFDLNQPFAMPRYGNACKYYITGRDYMKDVAAAIRGAQSFIMMADWQMDYDVELVDRKAAGHPGRLSELLAAAIQRGVHVRILLYDSFRLAVDTHDDTTQPILNRLPKGPGSIQVVLADPNTTRVGTNLYFSHHQKFVVVDGRQAFLGGIDLAYGRWETPSFDVIVDPALHVINDAYNMQIDPARRLSRDERALMLANAGRPGFRGPLKHGAVLDPQTQPRQCWEDVSVGVTGPAAFDVFVNFVLRWNSIAGYNTNMQDSPMYSDWFERAQGPKYLADPLKKGDGAATVQICRSASSRQLAWELDLWDDKHRYVNDDWKSPNPQRRKIVQQARKEWAANHQTSIRDAMVNCIRSAQAFIYIENQFFMTDCGLDQLGTRNPSENQIAAELANAIGRAIWAGRPFHVYLVLPEQPEGQLEEASTLSQAWWALQNVKGARNSLIHRINATLYAKAARARKITQPPRSNTAISSALASWGMGQEWKKYLTVLNLRNYGSTSRGVLSEMIYVHSKLTIVDDAVAIIGSANINDRSLLGNGDTELAAVVVDDTGAGMTDVGDGVRTVTRKFARDLRMDIWRKHFGMLVEGGSTGVQKEGSPPAGVDLGKPLARATIQGIQARAHANREAYSAVFTHTPRDAYGDLLDGRRHYPPIMRQVSRIDPQGPVFSSAEGIPVESRKMVSEPSGKYDFTKMPPLQPAYMKGTAHDIGKAVAYLRANVKGFFVEMPLDWGARTAKTPPAPLMNSESMIAEQPARDRHLDPITQEPQEAVT
ncbi:phospholipase D-like domain-containing protein [Achromobacter aloeverae]